MEHLPSPSVFKVVSGVAAAGRHQPCRTRVGVTARPGGSKEGGKGDDWRERNELCSRSRSPLLHLTPTLPRLSHRLGLHPPCHAHRDTATHSPKKLCLAAPPRVTPSPSTPPSGPGNTLFAALPRPPCTALPCRCLARCLPGRRQATAR
ncbi:uncharacterized protein LOC127002194 [Eriocheir sinensis]|uniref:uncharacterized protein LOC127002194 n=1 Tax=Eriocheir sinensis TaxID=95602 RepID=UPI0021C961E9|nr:uncharacterized protein LOC127002194 [Eriocheir sinensis]